jgi:hypothetical protein
MLGLFILPVAFRNIAGSVFTKSPYPQIKVDYKNIVTPTAAYLNNNLFMNVLSLNGASNGKKSLMTNLDETSELTDLENSIKNAACFCNNIDNFINMVKTKRYTQTRIQRILLFALLGITKKDVQAAKKVVPYARVLGFNENGKKLLSEIATKNPKLPVITSLKKFTDTNTNRTYKRMIEIDKFATDVYTLGFKYDSMANLDYTKNMIII